MGARILVAEDDAGMLEICARFPAMKDYCVAACSSAAEAAGRVKEENFRLLLTDINLGDGSGAELIGLLKSKDPRAKAIMMPADPEFAGTRGPGPAYADAETLIKPFTPQRLLAELSVLEID